MEAIRTSAPDMQETPCPACGAAIGTASIGRRRRVQCPKCREVVELGAAPKLAPRPLVPVEDPRVSAAKIAALEARMTALEEAAKTMATLKPIEVVMQRPGKKWKWLAPSSAHEAEKFPTNLTEIFLQNLANYDGHTIALELAGADAHLLLRATCLKEVFDRAHWTVIGPGEVRPRNQEHGLFLAVGSVPLPPAASAAYFAMTTSGFTVQSFLDPKLRHDETVLIVA